MSWRRPARCRRQIAPFLHSRTDGREDGRVEGGRGRDEAINKVDVSRGMLSWGSVVFRRDGMEG